MINNHFMAKISEINSSKQLSLDFMAGLVISNGYFAWINQNNQKVAVFQIQMQYNQKDLLFAFRNSLGLKETIYEYNYRDKRKLSLYRHIVKLIVRRRETIKKIIIPAFDGRLYGPKQKQFDQWKKNFYQEEKKWHYHYTERIPRLIRSIPESLDKNIKKMMIGVEKL